MKTPLLYPPDAHVIGSNRLSGLNPFSRGRSCPSVGVAGCIFLPSHWLRCLTRGDSLSGGVPTFGRVGMGATVQTIVSGTHRNAAVL